MRKGNGFFLHKAYDSALLLVSKGLGIIKKSQCYSYPQTSSVYNLAGDCYRKQNNATLAHQYYTIALLNARKFSHTNEKQEALLSLILLHREIISGNLSFTYPKVAETEVAQIYVPIGTVKQTGDSTEAQLLAGRWDGITDAGQKAEIFTHFTHDDTVHHKQMNFIAKARVVSIDNNSVTVKFKNEAGIKILSGDFAIINAEVPLQWRKLSLREFLLEGFALNDNYKQRIFHRRYFYYYADSLVEKEVYKIMNSSIDEVAQVFAGDTLTNPVYTVKSPDGIFAGKNVMKGLLETTPEHIRYFLNFINKYPGKYIGNNFTLSEVYATWVINNTPFAAADIKPYLLSISVAEQRRKQIFALRKQIAEDNLIDTWFDEGLQQINIENINEAVKTATLIADVTTLTNDTLNQGWSDFLFANIEKKMSNQLQADSFMVKANKSFSNSNNKEGLSWVASTRKQWEKANKITVNVQTGHALPYVIAPSGNPRYFATGGEDNRIIIWDKNLGKEIVTLNEHRDGINSLNYSPNGRYLVSASKDSTICIWNAYNYTLIKKINTGNPEEAVIFSPDNKSIVCGGADSIIRFRNVLTGEVEKKLVLHKNTVKDLFFHPQVSAWLFSCSKDSMIYKWDTDDGEMRHWYKKNGKVLSIKLSNDGNYMCAVSTDSLLTVWNLLTNKKVYEFKVYTKKLGGSIYYGDVTFSADSRNILYPSAKDSFTVADLKVNYQRIYPTLLKRYDLSGLVFSNDGISLFARFDWGGPLRIYNFAGWDIQKNTTISSKDIKQFGDIIGGVKFTKDDNSLLADHTEVTKLDMRNGSYEKLFWGGFRIGNRSFMLDDEKTGAFEEFGFSTVVFYDYENKKNKHSFSIPLTEELSTFEISPDNRYCFIGSKNGLISGWDVRRDKQLFSNIYVRVKDPEVYRMHYDKYRNRLFVITSSDSILIINPDTGEKTGDLIIKGANYITASPDYLYISTEDGWLYKNEGASFSFIKKIRMNDNGGWVGESVLDSTNKYLVVQSSMSTLLTILTANDSVLYNIPDHNFGGSMLAISHNSKMVASAGFDSKINLFDIVTGKKIVTINLPKEREPLISDDNGNYLASKNTLDAISFTYNNNAYSFDQFDVQYNRPDIILKKMGRADSSLINTYYAAWKKRLSRLKIKESDLNTDLHLPLVRLQDKSAVQPVTTQKEYELTIECYDSRYPVKSLQVLVNNSPLLGISGKDLQGLNTRQTIQKIKVPLSDGNNAIKVYCTNSKGISSLQETFDIMSKYKAEKPARVFFIGIAVADYKDRRMNLGYSAKDIRDLAALFSNMYSNITIDTFINRKATKENILAIRKKLEQTTVNDRVILAVTGHGLLSDSLDFYYATWDVDFQKPEKRGIKYDDLENLLTDIPARQKLMLIDACHSGALDKEELLAVENNQDTMSISKTNEEQVKGIASRGLKIKNKEASAKANSNFEMMQHLFTDLTGSNGAVIISASGGMEYAFESPKWNNGVFTYCIRKGIEDKEADTETGNSDGKVSVQELLTYVSRMVSTLTNGKQKPTSRRENIEYQWTIKN